MPLIPKKTGPITLQLGQVPVVNIDGPHTNGNYTIHFQIHTIFGHTVVPFKPKLKPGDKITLYTEVERDAKEDN